MTRSAYEGYQKDMQKIPRFLHVFIPDDLERFQLL